MLHWQLKNWLRNCSLKTKILCASVLGHFFVLFSLFILYRGNEQYHILITGSMINTDVPIVFLPMHKSLKQMSGGAHNSSSEPTASKKSESQMITPSKKGTVACALPEKKSKKKAKQKKNKESKNRTKKNIAEKKVAEQEKKIEEKPKPVIQETAIEKPQKIPELIESASSAPIGADTDNVLCVGQQEMDALQMQDYIQDEMAQHWSPPAGMKKNISCTIKVIIGFDGGISKIDVDQPSGVLIFDGAAKRAAAQLTPPQWAYGKEIVLTFKP